MRLGSEWDGFAAVPDEFIDAGVDICHVGQRYNAPCCDEQDRKQQKGTPTEARLHEDRQCDDEERERCELIEEKGDKPEHAHSPNDFST